MKLNRHQIIGRLVEDAEVSYLPSGTAALKLRVVTDDGWFDTKKKEYQKRPTFHTVKQLGKNAEKNTGLVKGDWVFIEGSRLTDTWEDRDGKKKYQDFLKALIIAEVPDPFEDSKKPEPKTQTSGPKEDFDEDDIPF